MSDVAVQAVFTPAAPHVAHGVHGAVPAGENVVPGRHDGGGMAQQTESHPIHRLADVVLVAELPGGHGGAVSLVL